MAMTRSGARSDAQTTGDDNVTLESADNIGTGMPIQHDSQATPHANNTTTQDEYILSHKKDTESVNNGPESSGGIDVGGPGPY
jgi:hypothetical protein